MAIKAILFDLGETLFSYGKVDVDELFTHGARLTYAYLKEQSRGGDLWDFSVYRRRHIWTIKWHNLMSRFTGKEFDCLSLLEKKVCQMGLSLGRGPLEELAWRWYQPLGERARLEAKVDQSLEKLAEMGLKMAIVSNTFLPGLVLDRQLEQFDLLRFFPVRVYSSDTIVRKPHPAIYLEALKQLGVEGAEAVMVGDKMREDVVGPGRLGVRGVFKRGLTNQRKKVGTGVPVITRISQLPGLLSQLADR